MGTLGLFTDGNIAKVLPLLSATKMLQLNSFEYSPCNVIHFSDGMILASHRQKKKNRRSSKKKKNSQSFARLNESLNFVVLLENVSYYEGEGSIPWAGSGKILVPACLREFQMKKPLT